MFEQLSHNQILVSGPQRSGTRICTQMVAQDTGLPYLDETDVPELFLGKGMGDRDQDWGAIGQKVAAIIQSMIDGTAEPSAMHQRPRDTKNFVLHCPPLMPWLHLVKGALVIVMQRPVGEITKSAKRIDWKKKRQEFEYNKMGFTRFNKPGMMKTRKPLAELKYQYWEEHQKELVPEHLIVDYYSLQQHPMWVPPTKRTGFKWNQTSL